MARTVRGGKSVKQSAARRGRKLIEEGRERDRTKRSFEKLREEGNRPSLKLGPLLNDLERT